MLKAFKSRGMCDSFLGEGEEGVSAVHILFKVLKPIKNLLKALNPMVLIKFLAVFDRFSTRFGAEKC